MSKNIFFKKKNIKINKVFPKLNFKKNFLVNDIKSLDKAKRHDITFFDSFNYVLLAQKPRRYFITTENLKIICQENRKVVVKTFYLS